MESVCGYIVCMVVRNYRFPHIYTYHYFSCICSFASISLFFVHFLKSVSFFFNSMKSLLKLNFHLWGDPIKFSCIIMLLYQIFSVMIINTPS